ncbi:hypothetical protein FIBSPDRAFT_870793 [Athelia psychrophila]|uniref:MYND-type domain-containing protein n=1 Tax=Athelia psychrophila TaxID=1759441 RepID=A0A166ART8_9AGAM|nr:hypothetical protein FIBSPDRAFT_870793 [Fibularhizoctonia sp. CBS 109695]
MTGKLAESWTTFAEALERANSLIKPDSHNKADDHLRELCNNRTCPGNKSQENFKLCAGCRHVFFCSKACQTHDWKYGHHREQCKAIQEHRDSGRKLPSSRRSS